MSADYSEKAFEAAIDALLTRGGYTSGQAADFDKTLALAPAPLFAFLKETQPDTWDALAKLHADRTEQVVLHDLSNALAAAGTLAVLRHGFKCFGKLLRVAFFAPSHGLNPDTQRRYAANRLTVSRRVLYSLDHNKSVDLLLCLNGLPIITAELKNPFTGQTVAHALDQYRNDRDPRDMLFRFKQRALVHFAVDPDNVFMTTRLAGKQTVFLPFNRGNGTGAGNPPNPGGCRTAYLWEEVWQRDSLLDLLARFLHLQVKEKKRNGKKVREETLVFPRYHQLDAVRKLEADARRAGPGHNYLIQHSAGSGKSNSIGWLAHHLANLHADDRRVFDCVVVITDRRVLDSQLQDTIYQLEHAQGVVKCIEKDSRELADALQAGTSIIVTTLQKFPHVTEKIGALPDRKYAVIVDEAHSSQSGEGAVDMKVVLASEQVRQRARAEAQGLPDYEEEILRTMLARGPQANLSFFAFTATPKYKTLEVFGRPGPDGKPVPFHLYSMRQAIEEGFILDVLTHYTTYKTYFSLLKTAADDPEVERRKAGAALARFVSLHPHNIAQKTEVMVEHFRTFTRHKLGGKAKAMVVTGSRMDAVRYKIAFEEYLREKGYTDVRTLVAFSGTVTDEDTKRTWTEEGMNGGIREKELADRFDSDEYQLLLVAEKYQTGFDQPLLHTMYVDKKLEGLHAVQTLSRLNRTCTGSGKEDTFVLDFVNEADAIRDAFQPYYEQPSVGARAEPRQLYALQDRLDGWQIYHAVEVENFCKVFFKPRARQTVGDQSRMNGFVDPAVDRFAALDEEEQAEFKTVLLAFRNLYSFLAQILPFQDADLEKRYVFLRFLLAKLPRRGPGAQHHFDDEVALKYYRLQKISEGAIVLEAGTGGEVAGPTSVGTGGSHEETIELSRLIDVLNDRFGTEFSATDQLFFDQIREEAIADEKVQQAARANTRDNFKYIFDRALEGLFIDRMEQNEELFARFMNDADFQALVAAVLRQQVYDELHVGTPTAALP